MTEHSCEIKSLGKLENWGGGFPVPHEFSTLDDVRRWNKNSSKGIYDEALSATDKVLDRWLDLSVKAPMGLYLYGGPGNGKTHVAVGLGRVLAENGVKVAYFHAPKHSTDGSSFKSMASFMLNPSLHSVARNLPQSIFSEKIYDETVGGHVPRGKSAIIFDDYRPEHQQIAYGAVEAAAEMGGLVIMTSNHPDPFRLLVSPKVETSANDLLARTIVGRENPEALEEADKSAQEKSREISASLASRMAAMFKLVLFTGEDYRINNSLWN